MKQHAALFIFVTIAVALSGSDASFAAVDGENPPPFGDYPAVMGHANHMFNAIHSSMRQFGSAWFHNGMSFFLAKVPARTQLYHGTHDPKPVTSMEWLAFEPEHALNFGRSFIVYPPKGNDTRPGRPLFQPQHLNSERLQRILAGRDDSEEPINVTGYLHTYRAKHDLNLLYIDGLAAGKTNIGTLETQDFVLTDGGHRESWDDYTRGQALCARAKNDWDDRIDGFIRSELGNEIILCNFSRHLDFMSVQLQPYMNITDPRPIIGHAFRWFQAIAARYNGIGGDRVRVDYDNFASMYTQVIDFFGDGPNPRLARATMPQIQAVRDQVDEMILHPRPGSGVNWQGVADMIVARYAGPLQYLTREPYSDNAEVFKEEVATLMRPFVDISKRDYFAERQRCIDQFIPPVQVWNASLAGRVTQAVALRVCAYMFNAMLLKHGNAVFILKTLIEWLDWSVWRECSPSCKADEVCILPIWPLGTNEDREQPKCKNVTEFSRGSESGYYWMDTWLGVNPPGLPISPKPTPDDEL